MAEKRSGRAKDVPYHPLVEALASDPSQPPKQATRLFGYPGPAADPKSTRLWLDLGLTSYVDVPDGAILHSRTLDNEEGTILWVDPAATLTHSVPAQQEVQAEFLAGSIAERNLAGAPRAAQDAYPWTYCCTGVWWCFGLPVEQGGEQMAAQAEFLRGPIAERNLAGAPASAAAAQRPIGPHFPSGIGCHRSIFFVCPSELGHCTDSCWPFCDVFQEAQAAAPLQYPPQSIGIICQSMVAPCPSGPPQCEPFHSRVHACISQQVQCTIASGVGPACPRGPWTGTTPVIDPVGPFRRQQ